MHLAERAEENHRPSVSLARTLGPGSIILLGIGALLGGGIFTLLGPAAGLAGPALFLAMLIGAGVAFLNLQMYLALGTTFPEAGGGYLWVRKGLGNFQGFLAGWLSWFAHAAACGLYALSFGFYARELIKAAGPSWPLGLEFFLNEKIIAVVVILIFGYINWRGSKTTGFAGNFITVALLTVLFFFIAFGVYRIFILPSSLMNFSPLMPNGLLGILSAASFFYIAFEGSEIQVQAGEETKNPARDLKIGLITSWAVVSFIYLLISMIIIGATPGNDLPVWEKLRGFGEGAIVQSARAFLPFGGALMIFGGLLANLAALNATIYSSSHVAFALARDKNIWRHLAQIHARNLTPHLAVILSTLLISVMVLTLPLFDVASAASLLFVLLFLQLNIAGIRIHKKFPDIKWLYRVPFFPATPVLAIVLYVLLALTMLKVNLVAWLMTIIWTLLGLVNYLSYAQTQSREQFEKDIVYEEAVRVGPKTGRRIILPLAPEISGGELKNLSEIAFALASELGGEIIAVKIHQVPPSLTLLDGAIMKHDQQIFENLKQWAAAFNAKMPGLPMREVNLHNLILLGRDIVETILEVIKMEDCDLLLLNWAGYTQTKGAVFGSKIDRILRESRCDLLVVKNPQPIKTLLLAAHPSGTNPYLKLMSDVFISLRNYYQPKTELLSILSLTTPPYLKPDPNVILEPLGLKIWDFNTVEFLKAKSVVRAIIEEAKVKEASLVIIGASRPKFLGEIRFGSIPELLAKHMDAPLMIVRGHQGTAEALWEKFLRRIAV